MCYRSEAVILTSFCKAMGDIEVEEVNPDTAAAFLAGEGPITTFWHRKYEVLCGFYRFALTHGLCRSLIRLQRRSLNVLKRWNHIYLHHRGTAPPPFRYRLASIPNKSSSGNHLPNHFAYPLWNRPSYQRSAFSNDC